MVLASSTRWPVAHILICQLYAASVAGSLPPLYVLSVCVLMCGSYDLANTNLDLILRSSLRRRKGSASELFTRKIGNPPVQRMEEKGSSTRGVVGVCVVGRIVHLLRFLTATDVGCQFARHETNTVYMPGNRRSAWCDCDCNCNCNLCVPTPHSLVERVGQCPPWRCMAFYIPFSPSLCLGL